MMNIEEMAENLISEFLTQNLEDYGTVEFQEVPRITFSPIDEVEALIIEDMFSTAIILPDSELLGTYSLMIEGEPAIKLMTRLLPFVGELKRAEIQAVLDIYPYLENES